MLVSARPHPFRPLVPQFYASFVAPIEARLSPLHAVLIACAVATQLYPARPFSAAELVRGVAFLTPLRAKSAELGAAAALVLDSEVLLLQVRAASARDADAAAAAGALDALKPALRAGAAALAALREGEDPAVAAAVHRAAAEFYKVRGPASAFYASALLFLGSTAPDALQPADARAIATDVALAALVGEGIFNFGEVVDQPILRALADTPHAWLCDLLRVFQDGVRPRATQRRGPCCAERAQPDLTACRPSRAPLDRISTLFQCSWPRTRRTLRRCLRSTARASC